MNESDARKETVQAARKSAVLFGTSQIVYSYVRGSNKQYGWCSTKAWPSQSRLGCSAVGIVHPQLQD